MKMNDPASTGIPVHHNTCQFGLADIHTALSEPMVSNIEQPAAVPACSPGVEAAAAQPKSDSRCARLLCSGEFAETVPSYPHPWSYRKDVADALIQLRFNQQVDEEFASDALMLFTEAALEAFGPSPFTAGDIIRQKNLWNEGILDDFSFFFDILDAIEQDAGALLDATIIERWLELFKGVVRDGKVLVRSHSAHVCWQVVDLS
jgi:hypothetical protein